MENRIIWLRSRPLVLFTPGFLLGLIFPGPISLTASLLGAGLVVVRSTPLGRLILISLAGLLAGQTREQLRPETPDLAPRESVSITATALGPSHHYTSYGKERVVFEVELERMEGRPESGRIRVYTRERIPPLLGGEQIRLQGRLLSLRPSMNPGQFDRAAWMRQRGFRANLRTDRIEVISGPGLFHKLRAKLSGRIKRSSSPKVSGLASALLLGERRSLDRDFVENLRKTGGAHFLAVSGLHLSVIAMGFWFLLSLLPIRRSWKLGSLLVLLWIYAFLTGLPTSVVRATIMMTLWLGADLVGKKRDPLVSLATAALLLLLWDPGQRKEIGFQLSFLAVLGIFLLLPLFPKKKFLGLLFVTLSAWAMTFPVVHSQFNLLSPAVSLTTLLFFPLILVVMAGGTLALLHPDAGKITTIAYAGLEQAAAFSASLPITHFSGPAPLPGSLFLYYAGLATWVFWMRHRPRAWKLALLPLLLLPLGIQRSPEPGVSFTVLAMGRGHCVYGEFSDGRNFLFDAGSLDHADPGRDIIVPFLWSRGITRIDFLFLSHPDADHVNGTESVLEHIEVGRIILPPSFRGGELAGRLQDRLPVSFLERAADPVPVAPGIDLLGPPDWDRFGGSPRTNDSSLVLLLSAGSGKILLTGDIEARATGRLLEEVRDLRADILVVPHHGKSNKNMEELIRNVDPVITIVPGPRRYASGKTLDLLEDKTLLLVTGTTGAIDVKPGGNRWLVRTFRGYFRAAR